MKQLFKSNYDCIKPKPQKCTVFVGCKVANAFHVPGTSIQTLTVHDKITLNVQTQLKKTHVHDLLTYFGDQTQLTSANDRIITFVLVTMCVANFTTAKFPFPIVLSI